MGIAWTSTSNICEINEWGYELVIVNEEYKESKKGIKNVPIVKREKNYSFLCSTKYWPVGMKSSCENERKGNVIVKWEDHALGPVGRYMGILI